jgi:thiamine pyrophosphate-dependent acetolactate synthase large subunit-like protein
VVSEALLRQNLTHCFGIVGYPCNELAIEIQARGINYFGFRNE